MENLLLLVKNLAPTVATLLNGPLGTTIIGLLATMFKTTAQPEAVATAIKAAPPATVDEHLKALEAIVSGRQADDALLVDSLNLTHAAYVQELQHGPFWSALRPAAGWLMLLITSAYASTVLRGMWLGNYVPLDHVFQFLAVLSPLAGVTGIYFWGRTSEKNTMLTGAPNVGSIRTVPKGK